MEIPRKANQGYIFPKNTRKILTELIWYDMMMLSFYDLSRKKSLFTWQALATKRRNEMTMQTEGQTPDTVISFGEVHHKDEGHPNVEHVQGDYEERYTSWIPKIRSLEHVRRKAEEKSGWLVRPRGIQPLFSHDYKVFGLRLKPLGHANKHTISSKADIFVFFDAVLVKLEKVEYNAGHQEIRVDFTIPGYDFESLHPESFWPSIDRVESKLEADGRLRVQIWTR
jgi:hypothetical protein